MFYLDNFNIRLDEITWDCEIEIDPNKSNKAHEPMPPIHYGNFYTDIMFILCDDFAIIPQSVVMYFRTTFTLAFTRLSQILTRHA